MATALSTPPRSLQLHAAADDFRNRKPGAQFIEELGRKAHEAMMRDSEGGFPAFCQPVMDIGRLA